MRRTPKSTTSSGKKTRYWSKHVMETSDALDLQDKIFQSRSPRAIAASLKQSALASKRRKGTPLQSAMSMLNFYINRAGRNLSATRKRVLERAKEDLRVAFGREPAAKGRRSSNARNRQGRRRRSTNARIRRKK